MYVQEYVCTGIDPIDGVTRLVGDFTSQKTQQKIHHILNGKTIDFIMRWVMYLETHAGLSLMFLRCDLI